MDFKDIRLFLFDMDGTIYLGDNLFPFVPELLRTIREQGKHYLFMTNNSSKNITGYVEKLRRLGIDAEKEDFVNSTTVTINYIKTHLDGKKLYVLGTKALKDAFITEGIDVYEDYREDIEGVVMGFDTELTFKKLDDVSRLLTEKDIPYIATNPDYVCPTEYGYVPDCGSVADALYNATKKRPIFIGKPEPAMPLYAIEKISEKDPIVTKENTLVIGDRLYTDIACGVNAGIDTVFVLSGEGTLADLEASDTKPTFTRDNIRQIYNEISKSKLPPRGLFCFPTEHLYFASPA